MKQDQAPLPHTKCAPQISLGPWSPSRGPGSYKPASKTYKTLDFGRISELNHFANKTRSGGKTVVMRKQEGDSSPRSPSRSQAVQPLDAARLLFYSPALALTTHLPPTPLLCTGSASAGGVKEMLGSLHIHPNTPMANNAHPDSPASVYWEHNSSAL